MFWFIKPLSIVALVTIIIAFGAGFVNEQMSLDVVVPPTHVHPVSTSQSLLQPSPEIAFPSSQFLSNIFPSPQIYEQTLTFNVGVSG
jgi:hypothetical protein